MIIEFSKLSLATAAEVEMECRYRCQTIWIVLYLQISNGIQWATIPKLKDLLSW